MPTSSGPALIVHSSSFTHPKSLLPELLHKHELNREVLLAAGSTGRSDNSDFWDIRADACRVYAYEGSLAGLLAPAFLQQHVLPADASFLAVTLSALPAAAITSDRQLHLRMDSADYQKLGLLGRKLNSAWAGDLWLVSVKLDSKAFLAAGPHYTKVVDWVSSVLPQQDIVCCKLVDLQPADVHLLSSVGAAVQPEVHRHNHRVLSDTICPILSELFPQVPDAQQPVSQQHLCATLEWFGALSMNFVGQHDWPAHRLFGSTKQDIHVETLSGMIHPVQVEQLLGQAQALVVTGKATWAAVFVQGFPQAPISWHGEPADIRSATGGGEDDLVILVLSQDKYIIFASRGAGMPDPLQS